MDNLNFLFRGISFIIVAILFYKSASKMPEESVKKKILLTVSLIIFFIALLTILISLLPTKKEWKKNSNECYTMQQGANQFGIANLDNKYFGDEDYISSIKAKLENDGYEVTIEQAENFDKVEIEKNTKSFFKDNKEINTFIFFNAQNNKKAISEKIYFCKKTSVQIIVYDKYLSCKKQNL